VGQSRVGRGALAAFCMPAFAIHALVVPITNFLPEFYANAMGLPVAAVGTAFMTIRILDMFVDPVVGGLMDHTRTRWGRFPPWLAMSAPILMVSLTMLFQAQRGVTLLYLWGWLSVAFVGFSMIVLSHLAWTATLASEPRERTRIFAWWQMFASAGQVCILLAPPIVSRLLPGDAAAAIHVVGWILVILIPTAILIAILKVSEPPAPPLPKRRTTARDYLALFSQSAVVRLLSADLLFALSFGITGVVALFFYMGQLGFDRATASAVILVGYIAALFGTPLFARLANRIGRARALQVGAFCQALFQLAIAFQPPGTLWLTMALVFGMGLCMPIAWFLPRALMADVADASANLFGVDRTGLLYATLNGSMKLALGLSVGSAFLILGAVGFEAPLAADPRFAAPLRFLAGGLPALLSLGVVAVMHRYPEQAMRESAAQRDWGP
jgi:Na+/melibiose symporter-like transporter